MSQRPVSDPPRGAPPSALIELGVIQGVDISKVSIVEKDISFGTTKFLAVTPTQIPRGCPGLDGTLSEDYNCRDQLKTWNDDSLALPRFVGKIKGSAPNSNSAGEDVVVQATNDNFGRADSGEGPGFLPSSGSTTTSTGEEDASED
eukprot:6357395-Pyramimonas_sp.AAC.1